MTKPVPDSAPLPVPSPCTDVCRIAAGSGLCEGCFRTLDEIAAWSGLNDAAKRVVWQRLDQRRSAAGSAGSVFGMPP